MQRLVLKSSRSNSQKSSFEDLEVGGEGSMRGSKVFVKLSPKNTGKPSPEKYLAGSLRVSPMEDRDVG